MIVIRRGYKRKYQVGGSEIFSKLKDFFLGFISKNQVVDTALNIARSAGQKAGQKAIDFASSKLNPKSQQTLSKLVSSTTPLASKASTPQKALQVTPNLNNLIAGLGQRVIKIQDLVRRLNKLTHIINWKAWSPQKQYRWTRKGNWTTQIFQQNFEL